MEGINGAITASQTLNASVQTSTRRTTHGEGQGQSQDILQISSANISLEQTATLVTDRAFEQLRGVLDEARAQLGLSEGQTLDTSAEATAGRIANFALGFFDNFQQNHSDLGPEEARQAFVDLIGPAIEQGVQEARDILGGLQALTPESDNLIGDISGQVQERLDNFLANGLS